ncbi:hypothetical protein SSP35_14_00860 [Streptomyces sp. NBRC 110611]|uniref:VOC family protein n=1 Tax=Streptomyces sp. NBRC 110611 TaxID=1621259 RepID=UPI000836F131|nr:VOC family protein [Streptomyces sp. NBRC 110611]GAU69752.1 hypothetical protein SSP35_14_00860 [Streptomyces sp. NBRC 110611]
MTSWKNDAYATASPWLCAAPCAQALEWYKDIFGATERVRLAMPDGKIVHAELVIGDSVILFCDELPDAGMRSPAAVGGSPVSLSIQVPDTDALFDKAVQAGATPVHPPMDMFYGARVASLTDPYGHNWQLITRTEEVRPEEMEARMRQAFDG